MIITSLYRVQSVRTGQIRHLPEQIHPRIYHLPLLSPLPLLLRRSWLLLRQQLNLDLLSPVPVRMALQAVELPHERAILPLFNCLVQLA